MRGLSIPTTLVTLLGACQHLQIAAAIAFSNPAANATLTKGATFDLVWTSVDTDPTAFSVYLVNFVNWPPYYKPLALDLETSAGAASVRVPCDADSSYGFQLNAIDGTNVYVIYAQTPKFFVSGDSCTDPVTTTAPASTCAAASTATVTVTVRGNNSSSPTLSSGGVAAPAVTKAANLSSNAAASTTTTYQGECPSTIGWNGNYSNPVTLTEVPHAGRGVGVATTATTGGAFSYSASTLMAVPTGSSSKALTGEKSTTGGSKCSGKKRQVRKRHSDAGHPAPFPKRK